MSQNGIPQMRFSECQNLENLNISYPDLKSVEECDSIFENSGFLKETL